MTHQTATLTLPKRTELSRLLRFMVVGASGTMADFATLTLLKELAGLPTLIANTLSFSVGLVNNFTWNRLWTFADMAQRSLAQQFLQFTLVSVVGLLLNNLIVLMLEAPLDALLGIDGYGYLPAKLFATGVVVIWNFNANSFWTFNNTCAAIEAGSSSTTR